jgi:putative copper resistance protein D
VHSGYANVISHPLFATVNFVGSLWLFYYTPIFRWATSDHIGHEWMIVHFLLAGYLFVQSLIGIDPVKTRYPYPFRLIQLLAAMTVHAFFGLGIMSSENLMLADWFGAMGRTWGSTPLEDQQAGGAIAWSVGELPTWCLLSLLATNGIAQMRRKQSAPIAMLIARMMQNSRPITRCLPAKQLQTLSRNNSESY